RVRDDWLAAERAKAAAQQASAVVERLQGGADMGAIAAELGVEMQTSAPVTRDGRDPANGLGPAAVERLFTLEPGGVASVADGDDQVVLRLAEIREAEPGNDPAAADEVSENLRGAMSNDVMTQFMAALQDDIPV